MTLQINPKFQQLLPPLSLSEYEVLEASILERGIEEPVQVWNNQIIDGHNRNEIAEKHGLEFETKDRSAEFETEEQVLEWIYEHQLGRRNLHDNVRTEIIGRYYAMTRQERGGDRKSEDYEKSIVHTEPLILDPINIESVDGKIAEIEDETHYEIDEYSQVEQPAYNPQPARKKAAWAYGVSESKVQRANKYIEALDRSPEEVKEKARAGKISQAAVIRKAEGKPEAVKKEAVDRFAIADLITAEAEAIAAKRGKSYKTHVDMILALCRNLKGN